MIIDDQHYDVIVIGSGAAGGTLAGQLARSGKSVLLLDVPPDAVEPLVGALGPEGLLITTTASSEETGLRLLDAARHWTRARA